MSTDETREAIARAINNATYIAPKRVYSDSYTLADAAMSVVSPLAARLAQAEAEREQARAEVQRLSLGDGADMRRKLTMLLWLHAEAVWQRVEADETKAHRDLAAARARVDALEAALESARRQMTRFERQRDEWKAVLSVYQGDIDTTPEAAKSALLARAVVLPEDAADGLSLFLRDHCREEARTRSWWALANRVVEHIRQSWGVATQPAEPPRPDEHAREHDDDQWRMAEWHSIPDVCLIEGCESIDTDQRGPIFLRDGSMHKACSDHWEAIISILGQQAGSGDAARWQPREPTEDPDYCPTSKRVDGSLHSPVFDGDDPYTVCAFCGQRRDARTGKVIP